MENENIFSTRTNKLLNINTCGKEMCKNFKVRWVLSLLIFAHFEDKINLLRQKKNGSCVPSELLRTRM